VIYANKNANQCSGYINNSLFIGNKVTGDAAVFYGGTWHINNSQFIRNEGSFAGWSTGAVANEADFTIFNSLFYQKQSALCRRCLWRRMADI